MVQTESLVSTITFFLSSKCVSCVREAYFGSDAPRPLVHHQWLKGHMQQQLIGERISARSYGPCLFRALSPFGVDFCLEERSLKKHVASVLTGHKPVADRF